MVICTGCKYLKETTRIDFQSAPGFYCEHPGEKRIEHPKKDVPAWIGFSPVTPWWCPIRKDDAIQ
jgi:hypothetical protein